MKPVWFDQGSVAVPAVAHGVVVQSDRAGIRAVRATNGRLLWRRHFHSTIVYSPAPAIIVGNRAFAVDGHGRLTAYRLVTGKRLWRRKSAASYLRYYDGVVYANGESGGSGYAVRTGKLVSDGEVTDGSFSVTHHVMYAVQNDTVKALAVPCRTHCNSPWSYQAPDVDGTLTDVATSQGKVFAVMDRGVLEFRASDGRLLRTLRIPAEDEGDINDIESLQPLDKLLFVTTDDAELLAFAQAGCGHSSCPPLWQRKVDSEGAAATATTREVLTTNGLIYRVDPQSSRYRRAAAPTGVDIEARCNGASASWQPAGSAGGLPLTGSVVATSTGRRLIGGPGGTTIALSHGKHVVTAADLTAWGSGQPSARKTIDITGC